MKPKHLYQYSIIITPISLHGHMTDELRNSQYCKRVEEVGGIKNELSGSCIKDDTLEVFVLTSSKFSFG